MKLEKLLSVLKAQTKLPKDIEATGVTADNRSLEKGMVFVCVKGKKFDGHELAQGALESGASWIVCERPLGTGRETVVENSREALGLLCAAWWGNPAEKLHLIGVTGTNGKTSVNYMLKLLLEAGGYKTGLIGTMETEIGDLRLPAKYTTPEPFILHSLLSRMVQAGCTHVVMECSSQALAQERLAGLTFDIGIFTNLSQDHLDYHGTMEEYFKAKCRLFAQSRHAVINMDDEYGRILVKEAVCPVTTYSIEADEADYTGKNLELSVSGSKFLIVGKGEIARIKLPMIGKFSAANAMAAGAAARVAGMEIEQIGAVFGQFPGITGRAEVLPTNTDYTVLRDYAHTPDGLEKIITAVRSFAKGRVVTLFGCAGNRDRAKRKLMSEIVARLSDMVILTSDNPRDEDEMQIINDALPGLKKHPKVPSEVIADRFEAIHWALDHAQPDDVLILAGKGHEDYQVLHGETIYFDEKQIVLEYLSKKVGKTDEAH